MNAPTLRQHWIAVLSRTPYPELARHWQALGLAPDYRLIRPPETGLMQVRARMGATGNLFNLGDATFTRAVVQLDQHPLGYGYVAGRNKAHAELAALIDALLQGERQPQLLTSLIEPLHKSWQACRQQRQQQIATSKVDFFTLRSE